MQSDDAQLDHVIAPIHESGGHAVAFRCPVTGNVFCLECARELFLQKPALPLFWRRAMLLSAGRVLRPGLPSLPREVPGLLLPVLLAALDAAEPSLTDVALVLLNEVASSLAPQGRSSVANALLQRLAMLGLPRASAHLAALLQHNARSGGSGAEDWTAAAAHAAAPTLAAALSNNAISEEMKQQLLSLAFELMKPQLSSPAPSDAAGDSFPAWLAGPDSDPFVRMALRVPAVLAGARRADTQVACIEYLAAAGLYMAARASLPGWSAPRPPHAPPSAPAPLLFLLNDARPNLPTALKPLLAGAALSSDVSSSCCNLVALLSRENVPAGGNSVGGGGCASFGNAAAAAARQAFIRAGLPDYLLDGARTAAAAAAEVAGTASGGGSRSGRHGTGSGSHGGGAQSGSSQGGGHCCAYLNAIFALAEGDPVEYFHARRFSPDASYDALCDVLCNATAALDSASFESATDFLAMALRFSPPRRGGPAVVGMLEALLAAMAIADNSELAALASSALVGVLASLREEEVALPKDKRRFCAVLGLLNARLRDVLTSRFQAFGGRRQHDANGLGVNARDVAAAAAAAAAAVAGEDDEEELASEENAVLRAALSMAEPCAHILVALSGTASSNLPGADQFDAATAARALFDDLCGTLRDAVSARSRQWARLGAHSGRGAPLALCAVAGMLLDCNALLVSVQDGSTAACGAATTASAASELLWTLLDCGVGAWLIDVLQELVASGANGWRGTGNDGSESSSSSDAAESVLASMLCAVGREAGVFEAGCDALATLQASFRLALEHWRAPQGLLETAVPLLRADVDGGMRVLVLLLAQVCRFGDCSSSSSFSVSEFPQISEFGMRTEDAVTVLRYVSSPAMAVCALNLLGSGAFGTGGGNANSSGSGLHISRDRIEQRQQFDEDIASSKQLWDVPEALRSAATDMVSRFSQRDLCAHPRFGGDALVALLCCVEGGEELFRAWLVMSPAKVVAAHVAELLEDAREDGGETSKSGSGSSDDDKKKDAGSFRARKRPRFDQVNGLRDVDRHLPSWARERGSSSGESASKQIAVSAEREAKRAARRIASLLASALAAAWRHELRAVDASSAGSPLLTTRVAESLLQVYSIVPQALVQPPEEDSVAAVSAAAIRRATRALHDGSGAENSVALGKQDLAQLLDATHVATASVLARRTVISFTGETQASLFDNCDAAAAAASGAADEEDLARAAATAVDFAYATSFTKDLGGGVTVRNNELFLAVLNLLNALLCSSRSAQTGLSGPLLAACARLAGETGAKGWASGRAKCAVPTAALRYWVQAEPQVLCAFILSCALSASFSAAPAAPNTSSSGSSSKSSSCVVLMPPASIVEAALKKTRGSGRADVAATAARCLSAALLAGLKLEPGEAVAMRLWLECKAGEHGLGDAVARAAFAALAALDPPGIACESALNERASIAGYDAVVKAPFDGSELAGIGDPWSNVVLECLASVCSESADVLGAETVTYIGKQLSQAAGSGGGGSGGSSTPLVTMSKRLVDSCLKCAAECRALLENQLSQEDGAAPISSAELRRACRFCVALSCHIEALSSVRSDDAIAAAKAGAPILQALRCWLEEAVAGSKTGRPAAAAAAFTSASGSLAAVARGSASVAWSGVSDALAVDAEDWASIWWAK